MATLSQHEKNELRLPGRPIYVRLFSYALPYVAIIALTLLLSLVFSSGRYVRAYLIKPLLDDVVVPHSTATSQAVPGDWFSDLLGNARPDGPSPAPPPAALGADEQRKLETRVRENFLRIVIAALVVVFTMPIVTFAREYLVAYALGRIQVDMNRDVCAKLLALPLRFHQERRRGDVLARIIGDAGSAHGALSLFFSDLLQGVVMVLVGCVALCLISWQLALCSTLIGPCIFFVMSRFGERIRRSARRRQEKYADVTQRLLEILSGIKVIKAFRAEGHEDRAYQRETRQLFRRSMKVVKNRVFARSIVEMLNHALAIGVIVLGAVILLQGRWGLTVGDLAAFAAVLSATYRPIKGMAKAWVTLLDAQPAAERFFEMMDIAVDIRDVPDALRIGPLRESVRLHEVSFSYGREPVLRGVSLEAVAGEVVAIVGRTGAGKTTLIDLLLRFHDPDEGRVEFDGVDLRAAQRDSLLEQIAVVSQEPFLFDGSIRDNLCYGRPEASQEQMLAAARAAHVDEFVSLLPEGYETEVGTTGVRLSGGQRQRITIARAILKDPSILIFDEATSALDSKSERYVQEAIEALLGGDRTVFMIAHRLSTIRRADKIVILENGTVSQSGTHAELLSSSELYRELVELQTAPSAFDEIEVTAEDAIQTTRAPSAHTVTDQG